MNNKKIRAVGAAVLVALWLVLTGFAFVGLPFVRAWGGEDYAPAYLIGLLLFIFKTGNKNK